MKRSCSAQTGQKQVEWSRALRALRQLLDDPERTELAFEVFYALEKDYPDRLFEQFAGDQAGRRLLWERPSLVTALADRDALTRMDDDSFGRAYLQHMIDAGL